MKATVYSDSTIFSYLFDERDSIQTYIEVTKRWWERERHHFTLRIPEEVIAEFSEGDYPRKSQILPVVSEVPVLPPDPRILDITKGYLDWNHLANANKYQHIRIINSQMLLPTPEIITPLTLFTEEPHAPDATVSLEKTRPTTIG